VASIAGALREVQLAPLHAAVRSLAEDGTLARLTAIGTARAELACRKPGRGKKKTAAGAETAARAASASAGASAGAEAGATPRRWRRCWPAPQSRSSRCSTSSSEVAGGPGDVAAATAAFRLGAQAALELPELADGPASRAYAPV